MPKNVEPELIIDVSEIETFDSINIRVKSPEGTFYFNILEDPKSHKPVGIIGIGPKSGSTLSAWLDAFCRFASRQLERGLATIEDLKEELSSIRADKNILSIEGFDCTSGPEALFIALCRYTSIKYEEMRERLGINDRQRDRPNLKSRME